MTKSFQKALLNPLSIALCLSFINVTTHAQAVSYQLNENWAGVPSGFVWGQIISVDVDPQGNVFVLQRCSAKGCAESNDPPLLKFDSTGKLVWTWGAGRTVYPHGMHLDKQGNIWITDAEHDQGKGEQVFKISPSGNVLMTLGQAGVAGDGHNTFNGVCDVVIADNGDIFVADGHVNNRIVKFSTDGKYMTEWGRKGSAPGEFSTPHTLAMDSRGRLFVGDRDNYRVQIFDQSGHFLDEWHQFGRASGINIDANDQLYVAAQNLPAKTTLPRGLYIASAQDGTVKSVIPEFNAEGLTADRNGVIYAGERAREGREQESKDALQRFVPISR